MIRYSWQCLRSFIAYKTNIHKTLNIYFCKLIHRVRIYIFIDNIYLYIYIKSLITILLSFELLDGNSWQCYGNLYYSATFPQNALYFSCLSQILQIFYLTTFRVVKGKSQVFKCHLSKNTYQSLIVLKNMLSLYSRGFVCFSVVLAGIKII